MTVSEEIVVSRRLRAPQQHGTVLIDPPREAVPDVFAENLSRIQQWDVQLLGRPLPDLIAAARKHLIQLAERYSSSYREIDHYPESSGPARVLLTGHQPHLDHPGVWSKNFLLAQLAQRVDAHPIHLLIDNDTVARASLRVPAGSVDDPRITYVPMDRPTESIPYEERQVLDPQLFQTFAQRVAQTIKPFVAAPLIERLWPQAVDALRRTRKLGEALAQSRHQLEGQWGLSTWEVPLSQLCATEPFHWFVAHLLAELPDFIQVHNSSLAEFRRINRLRSRSHPVPELTREDGWLEAPFWIWSSSDPRRQRLFVRQRAGALELSDRSGREARIPFPEHGGADAAKQLDQLAQSGLKIRPRALTTTMFARLFLGDLFIHGIGGAKYDELTDAIIRRFFRLDPPDFLVVTATLKLPVPRPQVDVEQLRKVDQQLRELEFHPEWHVPDTPPAAAWVDQKRHWIAVERPRRQRRERHEEIVRANHALQSYVQPQREALREERERLKKLLRHEKVLGSREFSFCLFPEETLRLLESRL